MYGPYVIKQQLGPVDYVVLTPYRHKTKSVCHVNLLKQYHERDPRFVTCVTSEPVIVTHETVPDETKASSTVFDALPSLPPEGYTERKSTVTQSSNVASDKPERMSADLHNRELPLSAQPKSSAPYWRHPVRPSDSVCPVCLSAQDRAELCSHLYGFSDLMMKGSSFVWSQEVDSAHVWLRNRCFVRQTTRFLSA